MPEDAKKNQHKGHKHEAKEQRKPRQQRKHGTEKPEKKEEKRVVDCTTKAAPLPKPEEPGPEFYQSLKRETDEILKITEEANSKYKKKEILSNWTKYEMPIESYEEIEEQENLGADYEKLIQAPLSVGGHFQFKHEKSWDINTGPSLYDKYFEINMENLATAISTIPFHERNSIDQTIFNETDIATMNSRAIKYKRKYYNDKSYITPELEAQDVLLKNLIKNDEENDDSHKKKSVSESEDIVLEGRHDTNTEPEKAKNEVNKEDEINTEDQTLEKSVKELTPTIEKLNTTVNEPAPVKNDEIDSITEIIESAIPKVETVTADAIINEATSAMAPTPSKVLKEPPKDTQKPVIASPEDLEKWLDDFLDG